MNDLHSWGGSYSADSYDGPEESLADFRTALENVNDRLNEPYGWGWETPDVFSTEEETARGPVFSVYFVSPRKSACFSVDVCASPEQEDELAAIVRDTVVARIRTVWAPFLTASTEESK
jgi:hypothetical protein